MKDYKGPERRQGFNSDTERLLEEAACRGAKKALGDFSDHDLSTKEGRGELRADLRFSNASRIGSEKLAQHAKAAAVKTGVGLTVAGIVWVVWYAVVPHIKGGG